MAEKHTKTPGTAPSGLGRTLALGFALAALGGGLYLAAVGLHALWSSGCRLPSPAECALEDEVARGLARRQLWVALAFFLLSVPLARTALKRRTPRDP